MSSALLVLSHLVPYRAGNGLALFPLSAQPRGREPKFLLHFALGISLLLTQHAIGQASYTAQVRGTVTDQTDAVVVNATVTITNDGTNASTSAHTDERGLYLLTGLRPSTYTIKAEATGFRSAERKTWFSQSISNRR